MRNSKKPPGTKYLALFGLNSQEGIYYSADFCLFTLFLLDSDSTLYVQVWCDCICFTQSTNKLSCALPYNDIKVRYKRPQELQMSTRATNVHRSGQIAIITATKSGRLPRQVRTMQPCHYWLLYSRAILRHRYTKTTYIYSGIVKCRLQQNVT